MNTTQRTRLAQRRQVARHRSIPRISLSLLTAIFALGSYIADSGAQPARVRATTAGIATLTNAPFMVAIAAGFFKDESIDIEFIDAAGGAVAATMVLSNSAELGLFTSNSIYRLADKGQSTPIIARISTGNNIQMIVSSAFVKAKGIDPREPLASRMAKLKGSKIAITSPGAQTDSAIRLMLKLGGLSPDRDIQILPLGTLTSMYLAFREGRVDGMMTNYPFIVQGIEGGGVSLVDFSRDIDTLTNIISYSLAANTRWLDTKPEQVRAVLRAVLRGQELIDKESQKAMELVYNGWFAKGIEKSTFEKAWKGLRPLFATVKQSRITEDLIRRSGIAAETLDGAKYHYQLKDVARPEFVNAVLDLGIPGVAR